MRRATFFFVGLNLADLKRAGRLVDLSPSVGNESRRLQMMAPDPTNEQLLRDIYTCYKDCDCFGTSSISCVPCKIQYRYKKVCDMRERSQATI